jgi:signal transduction histidine kinase
VIAAQAGVEIRLDLGSSAEGRWDRARLDQALVNLLSNAIKYGRGSPVDVSLEAERDGVELRIRDRGIGISQHDQARIFGRFERGVPAKNYGGLGLGLYIVQEIVAAHGGEIQVDSRVGEGSTFSVRLPRTTRLGLASGHASSAGEARR